MDLGLSDKVALVTASNRGTGQVIAQRLAAEGAIVFVHSLREGESTSVSESIPNAIPVWGDITSQEGASKLYEQCTSHHPVDILVNNFGTAGKGSWFSAMDEDWLDLYHKNTLSVVRMVRLFTPPMQHGQRGGRVINLGTIGSTRPNANMPHYYAAKGALANMTVSLAKALSGSGITVNLVSPGLIRTPEVEASFRDRARAQNLPDTWEAIERMIVSGQFPNPMGRIATREEVADLVAFLASDRAAFINGQNIRIDGGAVDVVQA
jgi:3-oxoacyl-[acyl-carrier protein] reductase